MARGVLALILLAAAQCTCQAACPVLSKAQYRNEPSPFGWPVSPYNYDFSSLGQSSWATTYGTCGGVSQSPIDISPAGTMCPITAGTGVDGSLGKAASYTALQGGTLVNISAYMRTAYIKGSLGTLKLADQSYTATQLHVTAPSLHTVSGINYAAELMVLHVPQAQTTALNGSAMVSVLFNVGAASSFLSAMGFTDDTRPISVDNGGAWAALALLDIPGTLTAPLAGSSYLYNGSVPVPPCTENVKWFVTTTPLTASQNQINKLTSYLSCYAGGSSNRAAIPNPPPATPLTATSSVAGKGVCRVVIKNSLYVGGLHDQVTCQAFLITGHPAFNKTAACWDTGMFKNYYSTCLGSPIDVKPLQAHFQITSVPANSFMFYQPISEVKATPGTYNVAFTPVNRSQIDSYGDFGYLILGGRRFNARNISFKAISSHSINGQNYAGELNIEHTLYGDDLHDLYNMSLVSGISSSSVAPVSGQAASNTLVSGSDNLHRVIVSIPLTIGAQNSMLLSMGVGMPAYSTVVSSGLPYNLAANVDINASLQSAITGPFDWYNGGLTVPGCANWGVRWLVFETPLQISIDQLNFLALPVSGMDSTRVNQTVISSSNYANHVWRNGFPPFVTDSIQGAEQMCDATVDWNYANTSCWAYKWPVCNTGTLQSPININTSLVSQLGRDYFLGRAGWHPISGLRVANTGRSIGVNNEQMGYLTQLGPNGLPKYYQVTQFNLHMPSEHLINGRQYAAELSVLHKNQLSVYQLDPSDITITSFLFNVGTVRNPLLDQFLGQAPINPGQWAPSRTPIDLLRSLGPAMDGNYYSYNGSLTAPPCTQGVKWFVFETALNMSQDQWLSFKNMFPSPSNNRPTQPLNGRVLAKNSFQEGRAVNYDFFLNRATGQNRDRPGPAWIIAPVVGTVLLAGVVMWAVFVREDRWQKLEGAGGLVDSAGRSQYNLL